MGGKPIHPPMDMRSRSAPGMADAADLLSLLDQLSLMHLDLAHMHHITKESVAVIDEHEPAFKVHARPSKRDNAAGGSDDLRPFRSGDIHAVVR